MKAHLHGVYEAMQNNKMKGITTAGALILMLLISNGASATLISTIDQGWYDSFGRHHSVNENYSAGSFGSLTFHSSWNNFFVFNLADLSGIATSATLSFNVANTNNNDLPSTEGVYTLFDVSTPISDLLRTSSDAIDIFDDLGSGTAYGSLGVSRADEEQIISITLNSSALADMTRSFGGVFAMGGALDNLFRLGGDTDGRGVTLEVSTSEVSEPSSIALMSLSIILFGLSRCGMIRHRGRNPLTRFTS
jgi:hypothetical protein